MTAQRIAQHTLNYAGAEIEGVCRSAASYAFDRKHFSKVHCLLTLYRQIYQGSDFWECVSGNKILKSPLRSKAMHLIAKDSRKCTIWLLFVATSTTYLLGHWRLRMCVRKQNSQKSTVCWLYIDKYTKAVTFENVCQETLKSTRDSCLLPVPRSWKLSGLNSMCMCVCVCVSVYAHTHTHTHTHTHKDIKFINAYISDFDRAIFINVYTFKFLIEHVEFWIQHLLKVYRFNFSMYLSLISKGLWKLLAICLDNFLSYPANWWW